MRTLALYWPTLSALADRTERLRSARHALGRLSPLVTGKDSVGLIEVGIDGLQARSGSERDIAAIALRAVGVHLRERPSAAVSSSRLLAALLARDAASDGSGEAVVVVPPGDEAERLAGYPVAALALGATEYAEETLRDALERCSLLGLRTVGALARTHGAALAARVGPIAGALLTLARGFDVQAIAPAPLPRRLLARASFEMPLTSLEEFRFPLRRLLDELLVRVRRDGAAVGIARLHLARERSAPVRAVARLPVPSADRTQIERLLLASLERALLRGLGDDGVISAQLRFDGVLPAAGDQLTLLGSRSPRVDRLAWSTAAIAVRYGADRVMQGDV
ncbi:MAG: hypothetical protein ACO23F_05720, partial [Candidatus Limnocylindrus sp.]